MVFTAMAGFDSGVVYALIWALVADTVVKGTIEKFWGQAPFFGDRHLFCTLCSASPFPASFWGQAPFLYFMLCKPIPRQ